MAMIRWRHTVATVLIVLTMLVSDVQPAGAHAGDGPPYDRSALVSNDHTCTNANTCTSVGGVDPTTGSMSQHTTVDIGGGAEDGSAWSFISRELSDSKRVPDGWSKATVTITFRLDEASASLSGQYSDGDIAEAYVWASVSSTGCPSCSASTGTMNLARHRAGQGVGPNVEVLAPGQYSITFETDDAYDGSRPRLGTLDVALTYITYVIVDRQLYTGPFEAFGVLNGPAPMRRAEVSTKLTVTSMSVRRAA
jgi:hypothetical protein